MCHFIPTRKLIVTFTWTKKRKQKIKMTYGFFKENVLMERYIPVKLELCKAVIKNGGKQ